MNDRDRLAADLRAALAAEAPAISPHLADRLADRLALGWTRLDEGRLARALIDVTPPESGKYFWRNWAAAIAKAYREDTE